MTETRVKYSWHVLAVKNLQLSRNYFMEQLGFEEVLQTPDGKSFLKFQDLRIILGECPDEVPAKETGNHSYFAYVVCDGLSSLYEAFVARGAIISSPLQDKPWGMRECNIDTPDGHRMVFGEEIS